MLKAALRELPEVEVVVEVARGSSLKRGSTGHVDFFWPLLCPFNYGSVQSDIGEEGDLLDALFLSPRMPRGARARVRRGAVTLTDRGMSENKVVCGERAPTAPQRR
jgi:inorganic pyrophosphatase